MALILSYCQDALEKLLFSPFIGTESSLLPLLTTTIVLAMVLVLYFRNMNSSKVIGDKTLPPMAPYSFLETVKTISNRVMFALVSMLVAGAFAGWKMI